MSYGSGTPRLSASASAASRPTPRLPRFFILGAGARAFSAGAGTRRLRRLVRRLEALIQGTQLMFWPGLPIGRPGRVDEETARLSASPLLIGTGARLRRERRDSHRFAMLVMAYGIKK